MLGWKNEFETKIKYRLLLRTTKFVFNISIPIQFPLDGLKLDLDEGLLKGRTKDLVGYLHEKLKRVIYAPATKTLQAVVRLLMCPAQIF